MQTIVSAQPHHELRPFVRAYAQRVCDPDAVPVIEFVPAQLEQVINFEFGAMPGIRHQNRMLTDAVLLGGAQGSFLVTWSFVPAWSHLQSFFNPLAFQPCSEFLSRHSAITLMTQRRSILVFSFVLGGIAWVILKTFAARVSIVEQYLLGRAAAAGSRDGIAATAQYLFRRRGTLKISALADLHGLGLRQFERRFKQGTGLSPKAFSRVARFQAALDAKAASPKRTWLDIAHSFGYYDQMHMVHDFESLGRKIPHKRDCPNGGCPPGCAHHGTREPGKFAGAGEMSARKRK